MSRTYRLSKSRFTAGLQCHRQLWWKVHEPRAPELRPDAALQAVFDMGNRVGEMQLRILWEEILKRFDKIELVGEPERVLSNFVMGYTNVPVIVRPKA